MKAFAYLIIAALSLPVHAANLRIEGDWIHTYRSQGSNPALIYDFYYDKRTAVRNGDKIGFWGKTVSTAPAIPAESRYVHEFVDCASQRSAIDSMFIDGLGVFSVKVQWRTPLSNTPAMQTLLALCENVHWRAVADGDGHAWIVDN
jgi:hypothetical protein